MPFSLLIYTESYLISINFHHQLIKFSLEQKGLSDDRTAYNSESSASFSQEQDDSIPHDAETITTPDEHIYDDAEVSNNDFSKDIEKN